MIKNRYTLLFSLKRGVLILMILVCANPLLAATNAHTVIRGTIEGNDTPLEFAVVYLNGLERVVYSEEDGNFLLKTSPGKHTLCVQLMGYEKYEKLIEVNSGVNNVGSIELIPNSRNLNEIVVNGKSEKRKIETKGFAVNVVETQKAAIQSIQTNELLDRTAGVRIRQDGGMGSKINYNINGLSGNSIKIFIDGTPSSNYGPSFSLSSIPPALIERIEIYKGVVPGYLSEDALGGAINIVLKQRRKKSLTTSYSGGSFNTHQWNAAGSYRWNKGFTVDASAFYNYSDNNYKVWGKDITFTDTAFHKVDSKGKKVTRFHDAYQSFGGKFNIGFTDVKWADQLLLGTVLSQTYSEMQNGATMTVVYGNRHSRRKSDVFTLDYSKKDFLLEGLSLKIDASYSILNRQIIDTVGMRYDWLGPIMKDGDYVYWWYAGEIGAEVGERPKTAAIDKDYATMARGSLHYRLNEKHAFFANYMINDFQRKVSDEFQPAALQALANTRDLQKNILAFTYENIAFSGRLRTNVFYKHYFQTVVSNEPKLTKQELIIDKYTRSINHNGYGATFSFALKPDLYLLASAEKALRLPSANELFGNGSDNSTASLTLKPESSLNANLGFNYVLKINQHLFRLNSSVYLRDTRDMIRQTLNGQMSYTYAENLESVFTRGFDAEFSYGYAEKLDLRFNVSKFDVLFNSAFDASGNPYNYYRMQIKNEPSLKLNGQIAYLFNNPLQKNSKTSVHGNINYVNGFLRNWSNAGTKNLDYIPRQYPIDLGISHALPNKKLVLSFDAKNILDQQVFDNFGLQKPGRAFYGKITYFIF